MKKNKMKLTNLLNESSIKLRTKPVREQEQPEEIDLNALVQDPASNLTNEHKKKFMEVVKKYNEYNKSIYREHNLKEVCQNITTLGKLAEKITLAENDDWFDKVSINRDMKTLADNVKMFEQTAKEMAQLQHRLESCYESIGSSLSKYFEIDDPREDGDELIDDSTCDK